MLSENIRRMFSSSWRESIAYWPLILRGNSAMPLFCTAGPLSVLNLKCTKSGVSSNCGSVILPSYAV